MLEGLDAIKEFWTAEVPTLGITRATLTTIYAEMAGDTIVEIGVAELKLGENAAASPKYIVHWKQEGDRWLWDKDIWNMS